MAKYTITIEQLIKAGYNIFDESWTTFVPAHKPELCDKIIRHYYFNEIGAETADRFKFYINAQLAEIMPYYNMLYETALKDMLPLYNQWLETTVEGSAIKKQQSISSGRNDRTALQMMVNNLRENVIGTTDSTRHDNKVGSKKWDETDIIDVTEQENTDTNYSEKTAGSTDDIRDKNVDISIKEHTDRTENDEKDGTADRDQKTTETTSSTSTTWNSDTPQGAVINDRFQIDSNYLTTYSHSQDSTSKQGTLVENDVTHESLNVNENIDKSVKQNTTETEKGHTDTEGSKKSDTIGSRKRTQKDIVDKAGHESYNDTDDDVSHVDDKKDTVNFSEGTTDNKSVDISANTADSTEDSKENVTTITKGNVNITRSELIRKYRENYINIDAEIIKALANNFMGIF